MNLRTAAPDDSALAEAFTGADGLSGWDYGKAAIIFAVAVFIALVVRTLLVRLLTRGNRLDPALATLFARMAGYLVIIVGFVYSLESLGIDIGLVVGALGIAGIALAFALKDILENFVAGVLLQLQRPFTYGEQVQINDFEGTVEGIDSRLVTILTPSGELVKIPSATVIKSDIVNYTKNGMRRTTLPVGVAYGTDLKSAQQIILEAVRSSNGVLQDPAPEAPLEGFGDSSIDFAVRFWHEPSIADFWNVRSSVAFSVEAALADADITIPFPQRTMWWAGDTDA